MWSFLMLLLAVSLIACIELPGLWKRRAIKELTVFSTLLAAGTGLGIAQVLHLNIPNPLDWISYVFGPAGEWMTNTLKGSS